ncbi:MAG: ankyrin repeat domain-containing protein [Pyrinomonadaceae bacterium]
MKTLHYRKHIYFLLIIFVTFGATGAVYAQSAPTRRLYVATSGGFDLNVAAAKDALKAGADINWHNDSMGGETMLIMAIKGFKEAKVIKFLLDNGADASQKDYSGKTALEWANQYNMARNRNGREIIAMLEAASGQKATPAQAADTTAVDKNKTSGDLTNAPANNKQKRTGGAPSDEEIKETLEKSFTNAYQNHFFGVKNKVTFEWLGAISVGSPLINGRIPKRCHPADLNVKVTMEDPRDGNQSTLTRGTKAKIGGFLKSEIFCFSRNGFDKWEYSTYEP